MTDRLSLAGIGNAARRIEDAHRVDLRDDVGSLCNRFADRLEVVVLGQIGSICVEDEREAFVTVDFGESAIDSDCLVASLDGRLAFFNLDRDMSVHDEAALGIDAEVAEDLRDRNLSGELI